jgi:hypothetical protein
LWRSLGRKHPSPAPTIGEEEDGGTPPGCTRYRLKAMVPYSKLLAYNQNHYHYYLQPAPTIPFHAERQRRRRNMQGSGGTQMTLNAVTVEGERK